MSSSLSSTTRNDPALIALPDELPKQDDAEDLLIDLQYLVKEPQLAGAPDYDEVLPASLSKQEIVHEQKTDDFC